MGPEKKGLDVQLMFSLLPYWWRMTAQTLVETFSTEDVKKRKGERFTRSPW